MKPEDFERYIHAEQAEAHRQYMRGKHEWAQSRREEAESGMQMLVVAGCFSLLVLVAVVAVLIWMV